MLILAIVFSISSACATDDTDTDIAVSNDDIDVEEISSSDESTLSANEYTFTDLANKLNTDADNVTISGTYKFDPTKDGGYYNGIAVSKNKNFEIIGKDLVIDGNNLARAFQVTSNGGLITFNNIIFINCKHDENGGAIFATFPISVNYCTFENNYAGGEGGAIYCSLRASNLTGGIYNSNFIANSAGKNSSAVYWKATNSTTFSYNTFKNHTNTVNGQSIFRFEGNNSNFTTINFINNRNSVCLDLVGINLRVLTSQSKNNTGTSVRIIGNKAYFGGCVFNNTELDNDEFAIIVVGNDTYFGGTSAYSKNSLDIYSNNTIFGGCTYSGNVLIHGNISNTGGLNVAGDLIADGDVSMGGCTVNGNLICNGSISAGGIQVGKDLKVNGNIESLMGCPINGSIICNGNLVNTGGLRVGKDLTVNGNIETLPGCTINGSVTCKGNLVNVGGGSIGENLIVNGNIEYMGGGSVSGSIICNGNVVYVGGFSIGKDFTIDGNSTLDQCSVKGNLVCSGDAELNRDIVSGSTTVKGNTMIYGGILTKIINYGTVSFNSTPSNLTAVTNYGLLNLSNFDFSNISFTNYGEIKSYANPYNPTLTNCTFTNNGGKISCTIVMLVNNTIQNNKGQVNLENCFSDGNNYVNYDTFNIHLGPFVNNDIANNKGTMTMDSITSIVGYPSENITITNKANLNIKNSTIKNIKLSNYGNLAVSKDSNISGLTVEKITAKITVSKITMNYGASKYITVKVTDAKSTPISNVKLTLTINKKNYQATTNSNGVATVKIPVLNIGSSKVKITGTNDYINKVTSQSTVKVNKAKTTVKVAKSVKKSKKAKITVKSKVTKKAAGKVKIKVKVYTGKKYKTYKLKTNKKGIAKLNTKKLKKGKHKLVITSLNKNYKISKKATLKIK